MDHRLRRRSQGQEAGGGCVLTHGKELWVEGEEWQGGVGDRAEALLRLGCGLHSLRSRRLALRPHRASARVGCVPDLGPVRRAYHLSNP